MPIRFGVIGAGKIGSLRVAAIKANPSLRLVAVYDQSKEAAERALRGTEGKSFSSIKEFLNSGLDAVVIATPAHVHEELCLAAFEAGLHVLCEKPLANTVEAATAIVTAAKQAGRILAVGFNLRYYPMIKFAREAVDEGKIGRITHVRVFGGHDGVHKFKSAWEYKMPESGGGAMMDVGIHMSDLARYFLGEITSVYGCMSEAVWHLKGSEDDAIAIFKNPEGIVASYHATWSEWTGYKSQIEIYGDDGMVRAAYAPMSNLLISNTTRGDFRKIRKSYPEIILREKFLGWQRTALLSFQEELADFVAFISGNFGGALADGHAGLRSIEVSEAVRLSSCTGLPVTLPHIGHMYRSQPLV